MCADTSNHDSGHTRISTNLHINTLNPTNLIPTHTNTHSRSPGADPGVAGRVEIYLGQAVCSKA